MKTKLLMFICLSALASVGLTVAALTKPDPPPLVKDSRVPLVETVHLATERFKSVSEAEAAGYAPFHGCVSEPQEGAMGIYFVNDNLVGDGTLDPAQPEVLLYEFKEGQMRLSAVEYIVIAEAWHADNEAPPVLLGQLLNYIGSPNRYGIPAYYELHVWAWSHNPMGTFADWNPGVSCDEYIVEDARPNVSYPRPRLGKPK